MRALKRLRWQVYIVDLHSRHGTHLSRRGETTRMLQPEVDTLLADGDVLTFGKVVGAGSYHVSPVMVRVQLLSGPSPPEPAAERALTPYPLSPVLEARPRKLSGHYGLMSVSIIESDSPQSSSSISVSSEAASSPSEQESDVEDEHACIPAILRDTQGKPSVKIPTFRSFMRDIYPNSAPHSPVMSDVPDEPLEDAPGSPPSADAVAVIEVPFPKPHSHSPIDLLLPSPSPPPEAQHSDPAIIGAWPPSRPESPHHSTLEVEVEAGQSEEPLAPELDRGPEPVPAPPSPCQTRIAPPCSSNTLIELVHCLNPPTPFFPTSGPFSNSIASDFGLPSVLPPPPLPSLPHRLPSFHPLHKVVAECVNSGIKGSFKSAEASLIRRPANLLLMSPL